MFCGWAHKLVAFSRTVACSRQKHHIQATVAIAACAFVATVRRRYVKRMIHESSRLLTIGLFSLLSDVHLCSLFFRPF
jgi:hypothetical protein